MTASGTLDTTPGAPSMSAVTALIRRVRAEQPDRAKQIPALALSAYARADDRKRALLAGFQEHMAKPVTPHALVKAVAALLDH